MKKQGSFIEFLFVAPAIAAFVFVATLALSAAAEAQTCAQRLEALGAEVMAQSARMNRMTADLEGGRITLDAARPQVCALARQALALAKESPDRVGRDCWRAGETLTPGIRSSRIDNIATYSQLVAIAC